MRCVALAFVLLAACSSSALIGEDDDAGVRADARVEDGCPAWLVPCGGACVDTFSSNAHCGACDRACGTGAGCVAGGCVPSVPTGAPPATCATSSSTLSIGGDDGICTGALVASVFDRALCACGAITLGGETVIDGAGPASLGARGSVSSSARLAVSADLEIATDHAVHAETIVGGALRTGALRLDAPLSVAGDAWVAGAVDGTASASIGGTLHTAECASVPASVDAPSCASESVAPPVVCRCDELPIEEIVEHYADPLEHDGDAVGLSPDALAGPGASGRVDLACGHYFLTRISAGGPLTIAVHGPTALYIAGSILADAPIALVPDPGATLDVFVGGTVLARAPLRLGAPDRPGATRLWVGGRCESEVSECASDADCCSASCTGGHCAPAAGEWSVRFDEPGDLAGLIAAPHGTVEALGALELDGAILAAGYTAGATTTVHIATASAAEAAACTAECMGETCTGTACADGASCIGGCCVELGH